MRITVKQLRKIIYEALNSRAVDVHTSFNKDALNLKWTAHRQEGDDEISPHLQIEDEDEMLNDFGPVPPKEKKVCGPILDPHISDWGSPLMRF